MFHCFDFFACLYSLDLRHAILFRSLLYHGSDFLLLQTLVRMFLSIDFPIPDLKEFHNSSTVEEGGALVISLESWSMSSKILSQFALVRTEVYIFLIPWFHFGPDNLAVSGTMGK